MADYTDEEKQAIAKFRSHFREIKTARIGWAIRAELEKHNDALWKKQREMEDQEHHKEMMKLPDGTRVLVKFGSKANNMGTIYGRGKKYIYVKLDNGERWKFPTRNLTVKVNDKLEKMTAESNQMFQPLMKLFNEEVSKT